jgi:hypothetical protein
MRGYTISALQVNVHWKKRGKPAFAMEVFLITPYGTSFHNSPQLTFVPEIYNAFSGNSFLSNPVCAILSV